MLGFHDFYAVYGALISKQENLPANVVEMFKEGQQYVIIKRICIRCKKKEEYIVQLSEKLQDWDVMLSAPHFVSEEWKKF